MSQLETVSSSLLLQSPSDLEPSSPESVSPATTPGSLQPDDEAKCLTNNKHVVPKNGNITIAQKQKGKAEKEYRELKRKWSVTIWNMAPSWMAAISIIQVLVFLLACEPAVKLLRFEPVLRYQTWRMVTYMLLHWNKTHLILNVIVQCLIAIPLEIEQGGLRTVAVYLWGVVFGALGACLLQPQPMVGSSAGVYALLVSHLAHIYLNFNILKYRKYRIFSVCLLAISDFVFYAVHARGKGHPPISLGAHASGGLAGILLGLLLYKGVEEETIKTPAIKPIRWVAGILVILLLGGSAVALIFLPPRFFVR